MLEQGITIFDGALEFRIDGFYGTRRAVDAPNLPKSICDALNGVLYYDDRQIITCITTKDYDKLNPRMELTLKRVADTHPLVNIKNLIG
jgi:Holliday junction resolvase RusA-like endonuclease